MELLQVVKLGKVKNPTDIRVNRLLLLKLAIAYLSKMQKWISRCFTWQFYFCEKVKNFTTAAERNLITVPVKYQYKKCDYVKESQICCTIL